MLPDYLLKPLCWMASAVEKPAKAASFYDMTSVASMTERCP